MSNLKGVPKEDGLDTAHSIAKMIGGILPLGGTAMELWNMVVQSPIQIRRDQFLELMLEAVQKLDRKQKELLERVEASEEFRSNFIAASIIAAKTHQIEKHKMLRNAIINGIAKEMKYDIEQVFLNFIDVLSLQHINLLMFLDHYKNYIRDHSLNSYGKLYRLLVEGFGTFGGWPIIAPMAVTTFRFLLIDLQAKGLIFISKDMGEVSGYVYESVTLSGTGKPGKSYIKISEFGAEFLAFIKDQSVA